MASLPTTDPILTDSQIQVVINKAMAAVLGKGRRGQHERDDVRSDAMYGLAMGLNRVDRTRSRDEIEAYLYLCAKNEAIKGFTRRRPGSRRVPQDVTSLDEMTDFGVDLRTPHDWVRQADDRMVCAQALKLMTATERKIVAAYHVYGFTFPEIAQMVGFGTSHTCGLGNRACRRVRHELLAAV